MWLKIFFIFCGIVFLFIPTSLITAQETQEIKIKDNRYEPQDLQIINGQIVKFINWDNIDHWPASNIHPSHGIYPEFDPKQPVKPGQSWQFQFNRAGIFRYHDHLDPTIFGSIIVLGENEKLEVKPDGLKVILLTYLQKIRYFLFPSKLEEDLNKFNAITLVSDQNKLKYWIRIIGGQKFIEKLIKDSAEGAAVDCHQEAHYVGRSTYKIEGKSVFKKPNYNCHSGYLHGAMEAFIASTSGDNLIAEVDKLCHSFTTNFSQFECLHGIGHGFLAYQDYDLPQALELCQQLPAEFSQRSCYGGVFMENIMVAEGKGAVKGHDTKWVSTDPHFPCNGVDKDYLIQYECYQMQTSRMLQIFKYDFISISKECLKSSADFIEVCYGSMGRDMAGQVLRDPVKIVEECQIAPAGYFLACIKGALNVIIDFWGDNLSDQPDGLCKQLTGSEKDECYNQLGKRLKDIFAEDSSKINSICALGGEEFSNICLDGSDS